MRRPTRVQFQNKDRAAGRKFLHQLAEHSSEGSARTLRGVKKNEPPLVVRSRRHDEAITVANLVRQVTRTGRAANPRFS